MSEQVNLTSPEIKPQVTTSFYRVVTLLLDKRNQRVMVILQGENNEIKQFEYGETDALNLIIALNKANLTTISLEKRILNKLIADGKISGTVSGVPD